MTTKTVGGSTTPQKVGDTLNFIVYYLRKHEACADFFLANYMQLQIRLHGVGEING